jgi:hypothetical protein
MAALSVAGFLALYFKIEHAQVRNMQQADLLMQRLTRIEASVVMPPQGGMPLTPPAKPMPTGDTDMGAVDDKEYRGYDFQFRYPEDFFVSKYEDDFVSQQMNVRLTSQPGTLFRSSGGPAKPTKDEFVSGYQMNIAKVAAGQDPAAQAKVIATKNPLVKELQEMCDGAGCPDAQYLVTVKSGKYLINVRYSPDYLFAEGDTASIVESIKE